MQSQTIAFLSKYSYLHSLACQLQQQQKYTLHFISTFRLSYKVKSWPESNLRVVV